MQPTSPNRLAFGFRALSVRNYRLYWWGQLVSMSGTWMQTTAQALLVLRLTHAPLAVGTVTVLQFLPMMLFTLFGGVIADRVNRYRLILLTQTLALLLALFYGTLVSLGHIQLWQVYILAFLAGLINSVDQPVRQTFATGLVRADIRANAVSLNSILFNTSRIIGPALAGVLIGPLGIAGVFFINAASYIAVLAGLLSMRTSEFVALPPRKEGSVLGELLEGLRYVRQTPETLLVLLLVGIIGTFGYNFTVILPLLGGFVLHLQNNSSAYGLLGALMGVGSLLAALASAFTRRINLARLLGASAAFSLLLAGLGLTHTYAVSAGLLLLLGLAGVIFSTSANTLIQLRTPDALRGRVISMYQLLFAGSTPIGALLISGIAHLSSVETALLWCALLCLLGVGGVALYRQQLRSRPSKLRPGEVQK